MVNTREPHVQYETALELVITKAPGVETALELVITKAPDVETALELVIAKAPHVGDCNRNFQHKRTTRMRLL